MSHYRHVFEKLPASIRVPSELRHRRVEVILLPLDEPVSEETSAALDDLGWPLGFFERTAGQWSGEPLLRDSQGAYETREELD